MIAGDFNDTEKDRSVKKIVGHGLVELSTQLHTANGAKGTYRFRGRWQDLDHIFGTRPMWDDWIGAELGAFKFLLTEDKKYGGVQPRRNYIGMKYQNGYSDHLPLIVRFKIRGN